MYYNLCGWPKMPCLWHKWCPSPCGHQHEMRLLTAFLNCKTVADSCFRIINRLPLYQYFGPSRNDVANTNYPSSTFNPFLNSKREAHKGNCFLGIFTKLGIFRNKNFFFFFTCISVKHIHEIGDSVRK